MGAVWSYTFLGPKIGNLYYIMCPPLHSLVLIDLQKREIRMRAKREKLSIPMV